MCTRYTAHTLNTISLFKKELTPVADEDGWECTNTREKDTRENLQKCAPSKTDYGCLGMRGDLLHKIIKRWNRKTAIDVKKNLKNKGERW